MPITKELLYSEEARKKLKAGVDAVANAVITTLGPKGRNVAIERQYTEPHVVHDGVTVAREVELKDPFENMGAQMGKEASSKTNDVAGDGTTTSMAIFQAIVHEGLKNISAGSNPMTVKTGIEKAVDFVNENLKAMAIKVETKQQMESVATISSASTEIGKVVSDALEKVGKDGTVTAEQDFGRQDTTLEFKDGLEIKGGMISPFFVTNPERQEAEIEDCAVVVTDRDISAAYEIVPFLNGMVKQGKKKIAIICSSLEQHALATLVLNHSRGVIQAIAIKAPRSGDRQREMLDDIVALVGGTIVSQDGGVSLETMEMKDLGFAKKIIATKDTTLIVADKSEATQTRMTMLRHKIEEASSPLEAERYVDRLAKLSGGICVINVGAATELEMKEKLERVRDAIGATKAAVEEGIVPGGGVALALVARDLHDHITKLSDEGIVNREEQIGMEIILHAIERPLWHIVNNAGVKADHVLEVIKEKADGTGFDVMTGEYKNMVETGIIDPVKVVRHAVLHGSSAAKTLLTTECIIIENRDDRDKADRR